MSAPATKQPLTPPSRERGPRGSAGPSAGSSRGDALRTQLKAASFAEGEELLSAAGHGGAAPVQLQRGPSAAPAPSSKRSAREKDPEPESEVSEECMALQQGASKGADLESLIATIAGKYKYLLNEQDRGVAEAKSVLSKPEPPTALDALFDIVAPIVLAGVAGWAGGYLKDRVKSLLESKKMLGSPGREGVASAAASLMQKSVVTAIEHSWGSVISELTKEQVDPLEAFIATQHTTLNRATSVTEATFLNGGARSIRNSEQGLAEAEAQLEALNELLCGPLRLRQRNTTLDAWVRFVAARGQATGDGPLEEYSSKDVDPSNSHDGVLEIHVVGGRPFDGELTVMGLTLPGVNSNIIATYQSRRRIADIDVPKVIRLRGDYSPHDARSNGRPLISSSPFFASMLRDRSGGVRLDGFEGPAAAWLKLYFHGKPPKRGDGSGDDNLLSVLPESYVEKGARKLFNEIMQRKP